MDCPRPARSGIGLATARRNVERLNDTLLLEAGGASGACFIVELRAAIQSERPPAVSAGIDRPAHADE